MSRPSPPTVRFLLLALPLMAVFYAAVFAPYPSDSVVVRVLSGYLASVACVCGEIIRLFDQSAEVNLHDIRGRFALRIVLDCAALDVQSLLAAAVLAYPASCKQRAFGVVACCFAIVVANVARIVSLYFVGVFAPSAFNVMHEEVLQIGMVLISILIFSCWVFWIRGSPKSVRSGLTAI